MRSLPNILPSVNKFPNFGNVSCFSCFFCCFSWKKKRKNLKKSCSIKTALINYCPNHADGGSVACCMIRSHKASSTGRGDVVEGSIAGSDKSN